jgi:hypothetical protein
MKQLYNVELTREIVVLAESREEAERRALEADDDGDPDVHAHEMTYYPGDWDDDCIPFGDRDDEDPDRTVGKWIELGAAPKLKKPTT